MSPSPSAAVAAGLFAVLAFSGCQTYSEKTAGRDAAFRSGNLGAAVEIANRDAESHADDKDTVLYRLEQGAILRSAALAAQPPFRGDAAPAAESFPGQGYYYQSLRAFNAAEDKVNRHEEEAKVKVGSELGAMLTNQANTPYRGRAYDKVMLNTYKALNYVRLGDHANARVELNRALGRQRDAVDANAKEIAAAQKMADDAKAGKTKDEDGRKAQAFDVDKAASDPRAKAGLAGIESALDGKILPYGNYVNPFSVLLDGLFFMYQGVDASDLERARKSFERVATFAPSNPYAKSDLKAAGELKVPSNVTYVIFETGLAPYRQQVKVELPLGFITGRISYVGAAFPKLAYVYDHLPTLQVRAGAENHLTSLVCSMDSVVSQDFKNEWPSIRNKTIVATLAKATIDAAIQNQARQNFGEGGHLLALLATGITQAAVNIADTRSWTTLPKEFHYLRLDTPANRQITIAAGAIQIPVTLEPGSVNVVYVKSTSTSSPLLITQFLLAK